LKLLKADTRVLRRQFFAIGNEIYRDNPYYRSTEDDLVRMLINGPTLFHEHARVLPYLMLENDSVCGRFAFVHDEHMSDYVQVAFFEFKPDTGNPVSIIENEAQTLFPNADKIVFGLQGHLNYGAGFLLNRFDQVPVFGLPYSLPHYPGLFEGYTERKMHSFRFSMQVDIPLFERLSERMAGNEITVRKLDMKNLKKDIHLYTELNNRCFTEHPYWTDREGKEDFELFESFRHLLRPENFLFAMHQGREVGFLMWFPDFNQMIKNDRELKCSTAFSLDVLRFRYANPIKQFRLTEIAVLPEYRSKGAELAMMFQMTKDVLAAGYKEGVGGFIFEENRDSINLALRYVERFTGKKAQNDAEFAAYEKKLQ